MGYLDTSPSPLRKHEVPDAVKALLQTARMAELLYGTDRVYADTERPVVPESVDKSEPWGRVIVRIPDQLFPRGQALPGRQEVVRIVVQGEVSQPKGTFDYSRALEAILEEAFLRLQGVTLTLSKASVLLKVFWHSHVNDRPVRDDETGLWVQSTEFRTVLQPVSA